MLAEADEKYVDLGGTNRGWFGSGPGFAGRKPLSLWAESSTLMAFVGPLDWYHQLLGPFADHEVCW